MQTAHFSPAIFLMGPTASGKSKISVQLAQRLNGEIISVDSALVYRGMDIGTAKPTLAEREGIPHHLIDIIEPNESFSTGQFRSKALAIMADIIGRGRLPILVGGTMLYFTALSKGLAELPEANPTIRATLDQALATLGKVALHQRLMEIDPVAATRIHPNDPQRVQRALEVYEITGKPLSDYLNEAEYQRIPYHIIKLVIAPAERSIVHQMIAKRFMQMLDNGFIEEVERLVGRGDLHENLPSMRAVGYRQVWSYLQGDIDKLMLIEQGIAATRQLAKRQFTWLRRETDALTFESYQTGLLENLLNHIENQLKIVCNL